MATQFVIIKLHPFTLPEMLGNDTNLSGAAWSARRQILTDGNNVGKTLNGFHLRAQLVAWH